MKYLFGFILFFFVSCSSSKEAQTTVSNDNVITEKHTTNSEKIESQKKLRDNMIRYPKSKKDNVKLE